MTRNIPAPIQNELDNQATEPLKMALLFFADFEGDPVYVWTGIGDLEYNGNIYQGVGALGSTSPIAEDSKLSDVRYSASLSTLPAGILPDIVSEITDKNFNGRDFSIDLAFLDANTQFIDALPLTAGQMNGAEISEIPDKDEGELKGNIKLGLASDAAKLENRTFYRQTNQSQQQLFPGDRGFEYIDSTSLREIFWGGSAASVSRSGGAPGQGCIADDMYLNNLLIGADSAGGMEIDVLDEIDGAAIGDNYSACKIEAVSHSIQPCFEIETTGGARLICSDTTPVTLKNGEMKLIGECLGNKLATIIDDVFEWQEVMRVDKVEPRMVAHVHIYGKTFAAGCLPNARIFTHNMAKPRNFR